MKTSKPHTPTRTNLISLEPRVKPHTSLIHALNITNNKLLNPISNVVLLNRMNEMKNLYLHDIAKIFKNNFCSNFGEACTTFINKIKKQNLQNDTRTDEEILIEFILKRYISLTNNSLKETKTRTEILIEEERKNPDKYKYYKDFENFIDDPFIKQILQNPADLTKYTETLKKRYFKTNDKYFILTAEENFWHNKINLPEFKDILNIEKTYYSYDTYRNIFMLKEYLIRLGYTQTFIPDKPNIDLVFFNNNYTNNIYWNTPAKIKNVLSEFSIQHIIHKDRLYQNMIITNGEEDTLQFMPASIVIYSHDTDENKNKYISKEYLKENILNKYNKFDDAITKTEHYIIRPVNFIADPRMTAGVGGGILILNFNDTNDAETTQTQTKILELLKKYKSIIISKFIYTKPVLKKLFNLRTTVLTSITKLKEDEHYNLRCYLCHIMDIMSSKNTHNTTEQSQITTYDSMNTHETAAEFKLYPMDFIKLELITKEQIEDYKKQIIEIIKKVMNIYKLVCQIYPETENGFIELGYDFMIGLNNKVYLAEINTDAGYFDYRDSNHLITSQYAIYNDNIMNAIIRGIIEPVLFTNVYIKNIPEYDGFTEIIISKNLEGEKGREELSIKETKILRTISTKQRNNIHSLKKQSSRRRSSRSLTLKTAK